MPKANVDHTISGQGTADSTLDHSATTPNPNARGNVQVMGKPNYCQDSNPQPSGHKWSMTISVQTDIWLIDFIYISGKPEKAAIAYLGGDLKNVYFQ